MPEVFSEDEKLLLQCFSSKKLELETWATTIVTLIAGNKELTGVSGQVVHSAKRRIKSDESFVDKIRRKRAEGKDISEKTLFSEITDLVGARILHIFQQDFSEIDAYVRSKVEEGDWFLNERPKAYTWDPEVVSFFERFDVEVIRKESAYTSVHYLVKPRPDSPLCCELQVRTLFEEIWGEVDHSINYPVLTESIALSEQLKVLSKITGAGSRILDSMARISVSRD